ncbi:MAG TPA: hypothetical protein VG274_06435 [Rhizomicrobium sp.]|nr:hypothetical protein [Rhizomicrobium sp.]
MGSLDPGAPARWHLAALLHDAPEYVIGDLISPFKTVLGDGYKAVENRLLAAIHLRFSLPAPPPAALAKVIKRADLAAAFIEATQLAGFAVEEAERFFGRPAIAMRSFEALITPLSAERAQKMFLARFRELEQNEKQDA